MEEDLELIEAVKSGNLEQVDNLIKSGVEVDQKDSYMNTPLIISVQKGHSEIVKKLLQNSANVNCINLFNETPISLAIRNGLTEVFSNLIKFVNDVNQKNDSLINAAILGHCDIVEILIKNGADINAYGEGGTALGGAANAGKIRIVEFLLKYSASVNERDNIGRTALIRLAESSKKTILPSDRVKIFDILLEYGADINAKDNFGNSAFLSASYEGNFELVEKMLNMNVDINQKNVWQSTALMLAAKGGHSEIVEMLIRNRVCLNEEDIYGDTALLISINKERSIISEMLIKNGADILHTNNDGYTALELASNIGDLKIVNILIVNGAKVTEDILSNIKNTQILDIIDTREKRLGIIYKNIKLLMPSVIKIIDDFCNLNEDSNHWNDKLNEIESKLDRVFYFPTIENAEELMVKICKKLNNLNNYNLKELFSKRSTNNNSDNAMLPNYFDTDESIKDLKTVMDDINSLHNFVMRELK